MDPAEEFSSILQSVPNLGLDELSTDELNWITFCLFERVSFCRCLVTSDGVHNCMSSGVREIHNPYCLCCQTRIFSYFLGRFLQRLCMDGRLPLFSERVLSRSKIHERTYCFSKDGMNFCFRIIRHLNAFKDPVNTTLIEQTWKFSFSDLSLSLISPI